jgi:arsenite-transporting ATPase
MVAASDPPLTAARLLIVVGKGGVGKTTVTAAAALATARAGGDVLVVAVAERPGLGPLLGGRRLDATDRVLHTVAGGGRIRGRTIPAEQAFGDYLELKGVGGMLRRAASAASLPMIAAATPGLEHLLVLGKLKELELAGAADLIIVDAPPAGHAAPFLRAPTALSDVVQSGPVRDQAVEVDELLRDPARAAAVVVALAEETPVTEAVELTTDLRADVGIHVDAAIVNACWHDRPGLDKSPAMAARSHRDVTLSPAAKAALESSARFGRQQLARQRAQVDRLQTETGLPVRRLPRLVTADLELADLDVLADALVAPPSEPPTAAGTRGGAGRRR